MNHFIAYRNAFIKTVGSFSDFSVSLISSTQRVHQRHQCERIKCSLILPNSRQLNVSSVSNKPMFYH